MSRRTLLSAASLAAGGGLLSSRADAADAQSLQTAVYTGPGGLNSRSFVVYGEPERDERTICTADVSWRHPVVVPPRSDGGDAIYTDLFADEQYAAGSVIELVDRLSACPEEAGTLIFMREVASPEE